MLIAIYLLLNLFIIHQTWNELKTDYLLIFFMLLFGSVMVLIALIIIILRIK